VKAGASCRTRSVVCPLGRLRSSRFTVTLKSANPTRKTATWIDVRMSAR